MKYELIEAKTNGGSDILLLIDGKVVSRWAELADGDTSELWAWDNQANAGHDLSDYQAALDGGHFDVTVITTELESPWPNSTELQVWANEFTWGLLSPANKAQVIADLAIPISGETDGDAKFRVNLANSYAAILAESLERGERAINADRHPITRVK